MKVFIIGAVRGVSDSYRRKLEEYAYTLEGGGDEVYLPHRDTKQDGRGIDICRDNMVAIEQADEVHIFYTKESTGTHFDMGVAFALKKDIVVIENVEYGEGKSYPRMLVEWETLGIK